MFRRKIQNRFNAKLLSQASQSGVTILEVMVAVAIFLIVIAAVSSSIAGSMQVGRKTIGSVRYEKWVFLLDNYLIANSRALFESLEASKDCKNLDLRLKQSFTRQTYKAADLTIEPVAGGNFPSLPATDAFALQRNIRQRCLLGGGSTNNAPAGAATETLSTCLVLSEPSNRLWSSDLKVNTPVFIEVTLSMTDLLDGAVKKCTDFTQDADVLHGIQVAYRMYWSESIGERMGPKNIKEHYYVPIK